ncbi:MAG: hypothetical protein V1921_09200 [Candidatus Altiarchaeota archaeon]
MDGDFKSSLNNLMELFSDKEEVSLKDASSSLSLQEQDILEMGKILQEKGIIKIHYTVVGDIMLQKGENFSKEEVREDIAATPENNKGQLDDILKEIRMKIFEKRYGKSKGQSSLEYMIMLGIALGAFTLVLYVVGTLMSSTSSQINVGSSAWATEQIREAADFVYVHGHPSKIQISVYFPSDTYNVSVYADKVIESRLDIPPDHTDVYSVVRGNVTGNLSKITHEGYYVINVESVDSRVQNITVE